MNHAVHKTRILSLSGGADGGLANAGSISLHDIAGAGGPLTKGFSKFQHSSCSHGSTVTAVLMLNGAADGVVPPESSEHHARATSRRATNVVSFRSPDPRLAGLGLNTSTGKPPSTKRGS